MNAIHYSYEHIGTLNPYLSALIFITIVVGGMLIISAMYLLPSIIAVLRNHPQKQILIGANILLAWTGLGWLALLAWSLWQRNDLLALNKRFPALGQDWGPYQDRTQSYGGTNHSDALAQLNQLRERGILSEDEFTKAKERLSNKS